MVRRLWPLAKVGRADARRARSGTAATGREKSMTTPRANRETILQAFDLFVAAGDVVELRAPIRRGRTIAGYFNDRTRFVTEVLRLSGQVPGVYWTENPVRPALLARACNRVEQYATTLTSDGDILSRRRIPFDLDATRPAGISATDAEHALALDAADRTIAFLVDHGVPRESLLDNDSGNGAHVHLAVELPNEQAATTLVRTILAVVAAHVDTERGHVDQTMFNASRIIKVPGTLAAKGDPLPERPHRLAPFRTVPTRWVPVETAVLHALAALHSSAPPQRERDAPRTGARSAFDVRAFFAAHQIDITREKPWQGVKGNGTFLELGACIFDASHDRGEAGVILLDSGMLLYKCQHASCSGKLWSDVRTHLEPRRPQAWKHIYEPPPSPEWEPGLDDDEPPRADNPWERAISAAALLDEADPVLDWLEPRLLSPEAITQWYSPRGLGKTQVALAIAIKLARAGHRILLLDRDNPQREVKRRLRAWGAEGLATLEIMTRDDVPHLLDRTAWAKFPRGKYALVIIDSWDASSEGIGEQDSAKPSQATATLNDLAHVAGGPAVLVLGNTVKSGSHGRGSGVVEDRADLVYEVRDATDLQPSGTRAWWAELPPAGRDAWVDRAGRRKHRERCRLAFVSSKFRLGEEPDPFAVELDFTTTPWSMRDVTADLVAAGEAAAAEAKEQAGAIRARAVAALRTEVEARAAAKEPPYISKRAVTFLRVSGVARDQARRVLEEEDGRAWRLKPGGKTGRALLVLPLGDTVPPAPEASPPEAEPAVDPHDPHEGQNRVDIADQPDVSEASDAPAAQRVAERGSFRTTLEADRTLPPSANPCATRALETSEMSGWSARQTPPDASPTPLEAPERSHDPEIPLERPRCPNCGSVDGERNGAAWRCRRCGPVRTLDAPPQGITREDVLAVFPGAQVVVESQPAVWPPAEAIEPTTDSLVLLARAKGTPCVPLAPGLTIVGTDAAWHAFAATASPTDRAAARNYLEQLGAVRVAGEEFPA